MPSIGGITVWSLGGFDEKPALAMEDVSAEGVDGVELRELHTRGDSFRMLARLDCDSLSAANDMYDDFRELRGTLVIVQDDYGKTLSQVAVLDVRRVEQRKIIKAVGGVSTSKGAWLEAEFTLLRTQ